MRKVLSMNLIFVLFWISFMAGRYIPDLWNVGVYLLCCIGGMPWALAKLYRRGLDDGCDIMKQVVQETDR